MDETRLWDCERTAKRGEICRRNELVRLIQRRTVQAKLASLKWGRARAVQKAGGAGGYNGAEQGSVAAPK